MFYEPQEWKGASRLCECVLRRLDHNKLQAEVQAETEAQGNVEGKRKMPR